MRGLWMIGALCLAIGCSSSKTPEAAATAESTTATEATAPEGASQPQPTSAAINAGVTAQTQPLIKQATQFIAQKKFGDAFEKLNETLKVDANCAAAYFIRAGIFADAGQNASALADFTKAITLQPKQADFYNGRGFFLLTRQKMPEAAADFARTIKLNPAHVQAYNNHGLALVSMQKYKAAIASFTAALKLTPKNADALNNRGFAYYQAEDFDNALADFDATLRVNPNYLNAYNNKGLLYFRQENYADAIAQFDECIARDRLNAKYYRHRREAHVKLEHEDEARQDLAMINWLTDLARYSALAGQAPKDPARWVQRGNHLIEGSEFAAAKIDFERALKLNPKFTPAHIGQAHLLLQQGQHDAALAECETALKLEATEAGYSMRGDVYLKMGQYDRAIEDFAAAKRYDATVAEAFMLRSKQKREQGQAEQADADMQQAIALDPNLDTSRN